MSKFTLQEIVGFDEKEKNPATRICLSDDWQKNYSDRGQLIGIFNKGKELVGEFSLFKGTKLNQQYYITPPYSSTIGLFIRNPAKNPSQRITFVKNIMVAIADYLSDLKGLMVDVTFPEEFIDIQSFIWREFDISVHYTYQLDLNHSMEQLLANCSTERRKNIQKAKIDGLICKASADKTLIFNMVIESLKKNQAPYDESIVKKIIFDFSNAQNSIAFISYYNDVPLALSFCVFNDHSAHYIFGGTNTNKVHEGAGALALWYCISHCKEKGIPLFDFEGSSLPQIEKYFRGFGGELIPRMNISKKSTKGKVLLKLKRGS